MRLDHLQNLVLDLKQRGSGNPRIHPNGFIQLDLTEVEEDWHRSHKKGHSGSNKRLHIWNPPGIILPHQETYNEVHDHVFDMHSTVVYGTLWQVLYEFHAKQKELYKIKQTDEEVLEIDPHVFVTHEKYQAVYSKTSDSRLQSTGEKGWLRERRRFPVSVQNLASAKAENLGTYVQPAFTLHDTVTDGLLITVMTKTEIHEGEATVICPIGSPPDNSFDRASAMPSEDIWDAIDISIKTAMKQILEELKI